MLLIYLHFTAHYLYINLMKKYMITFLLCFFCLWRGLFTAAIDNFDKNTLAKECFLAFSGVVCCILGVILRRRYKGYFALL